jgi:hypothetical protein
MRGNNKFTIKGGFGFDNLVGQPEDLNEWFKKENDKNMREKDPILRAFNMVNLNVNDKILPPNPMPQSDIEELEKFPFNQINDLAPPSNNMQKVLEIQQRLPEEILTQSGLSSSDIAQMSSLLGMQQSKATDFVKYLRGEIKTL